MWVVKLGGSLARSTPAIWREWLRTIAELRPARCVIVPGGGRLADAVREEQTALGIDDVAAHRMALLAMDQAALACCSVQPNLVAARSLADIDAALAENRVPVWMPSALAAGASDLAASWDVTSDSLAAWLAGRLRADGLVLVKSCALPEPLPDSAALARAGIVDAAFPTHLASARCRFACLEAMRSDRLAVTLAGQCAASVR